VKRLSLEADRVQILRAHVVDPGEQVIEIVVLGMEVAAGERVVAPGRKCGDEPGSLRRRPGRVVASLRGMSVRTSPGLKKNTGIRPASSAASPDTPSCPGISLRLTTDPGALCRQDRHAVMCEAVSAIL